MTKQLQKEVTVLKEQMIELSTKVEDKLHHAIEAVFKRDAAMAQSVIDGDRDVDLREVELEEECLKVLALYQPVASDLRIVVSVLKINNDIERIGDLAVNIAQRAQKLSAYREIVVPEMLRQLAAGASQALRDALRAFMTLDDKLAQTVVNGDPAIDELNRQMYGWMEEQVCKKPELVSGFLLVLSTSKHLERVADHAANVAEDVIYLMRGDIVRHTAMEELKTNEG